MNCRITAIFLALAAGVPALGQRATVRQAPAAGLPVRVDGNSPSFWREGQFHFITSGGEPILTYGPTQMLLLWGMGINLPRTDHMPMWIESVWIDADGTVYGWYHHEPQGRCAGSDLTAPEIGAVVSYDGGRTFFDLGLILTSGDPLDCGAKNGFFAGGHGDFSVILDREQKYYYFFFTNYGGDVSSQGVAIARLKFEDRGIPAGAVQKWFEGDWLEPGLGGKVTPVFRTGTSWSRSDTDSFWGPAVHWNTHLEGYVILMNHACCAPRWPQEGIYVTFNSDISDPSKWSLPARILRGEDIGMDPGFYPQVVGKEEGGTDTLAGSVARLWIHGYSRWEIQFEKTGAGPPPVIVTGGGSEEDPGIRDIVPTDRPNSAQTTTRPHRKSRRRN